MVEARRSKRMDVKGKREQKTSRKMRVDKVCLSNFIDGK
jgi:hypothetical protein